MCMTCNVIIDKHTEEVFIRHFVQVCDEKKIKFKNKKKGNIL